MDIKTFASALAQIAEEKKISKEKVLESIEMAIAAAYKKDYGKRGQVIRAKLEPKSGKTEFWQVKLVVDKSMLYSEEELEKLKTMPPEAFSGEEKPSFAKASEGKEKIRFNPEKHILLEEAKKINLKIKAGEELEIHLETKKDYGRIAAQTAKQVIIQKIREAEKTAIFNEFKSKEGEIISGIVQRLDGKNIYFNIDRTLGLLPREEQVPGEFYRPGQRLKVFVLKVEETPRGPMILLSRAYPKLVSRLFELEVPEIQNGQVEIKSIAREPGSRTKIAVSSKEEGVDPIGAVVGQKGTRVQAVINELGGEKIDIINYSDDPAKYIANSLSPAKVVEVKLLQKNKALAIVQEDQLSLAIGKEGQNVRLAAKLTGWKIDVRPPGKEKNEEVAEEAKEEKK
jgi:N utilization substance protein A